MKKNHSKILSILLSIILLISSCSVTFNAVSEEKGKDNRKPTNYKNGKFVNKTETQGMTESFFTVAYKFLFENNGRRKPNFKIPIVDVNVDSFANKNSDNLSVIWLGHASTLINIDGTIILTDPMLTKWASPVAWIGPKRFFNSPIEFEDFPILDIVIISHNHYDHLDKESILSLNSKTKKFLVPIGVGAILKKWGILKEKIIEQKWEDSFQLNEKTEIITTQAHHFSGRGFFDRNKTLWASFVIKSKNHSIYFGGDSGYFNGYKEIGEEYGPFDINILPIGAYSDMWESIHMDAKEGVQANLDLGGGLLFPIHWGTFNLALHGWTEPAEELITFAEKRNVRFVIPKPGEVVNFDSNYNSEKWWQNKKERMND